MKKTCGRCGKQIPQVALECVFCGAKQPGDVEGAAGGDGAANAATGQPARTGATAEWSTLALQLEAQVAEAQAAHARAQATAGGPEAARASDAGAIPAVPPPVAVKTGATAEWSTLALQLEAQAGEASASAPPVLAQAAEAPPSVPPAHVAPAKTGATAEWSTLALQLEAQVAEAQAAHARAEAAAADPATGQAAPAPASPAVGKTGATAEWSTLALQLEAQAATAPSMDSGAAATAPAQVSAPQPTVVTETASPPGETADGTPFVGASTREFTAIADALAETPLAGAAPFMGAATREFTAVADALGESAPAPAGVTASAEASVPYQARLTAAMPAVQLPADAPDEAGQSARAADDAESDTADFVAPPRAVSSSRERPFAGLGRAVMGLGGLVLLVLFFLPWHGVSSWRLLDTLVGADFARQLFFLAGGAVLLTAALLPVPFAFRAGIGALVASTPIVLGADGVLEGWRGVIGALALVGLPATQLLRARARSSRLARLLVLSAVAAVAVLYLVPDASVVPIVALFRMIGAGDLGLKIMGVLVLVPLVFAGLAVLGLLGRELADVGLLVSVLSLFWAPVVVALRGVFIDDATQIYIALGILWASATSALSLAQLLSLAARPSSG